MRKRTLSIVSLGFILILICSIPMVTFLLPKGKAVYHLAISLNMMREGNAEGAVEQAKKAVALRPDNVVTLRGLAKAYTYAGIYDDEAMETITKLIEVAPELGEAYYYLAVIKFERLDLQGAREAAQKSISLSPEFPDPYQLLGAIAMEEGDLDAAQKYLAKAVEFDPADPHPHYLLGGVYYEKKDYFSAIEQFKKVTRMAPNYAPARVVLGECYAREKLYVHALAELKAAVDLDPTDSDSMYRVAAIYALQDKPEPALRWLERAIDKGFAESLQPDPSPVHALFGICYLQTGAYDRALSEFDTAVKINPADFNSMYNIACAYSLQNRPEHALEWLERAVDTGFSDVQHMEQDPDLDNIRESAAYDEIAKKAAAGRASGEMESENKPGTMSE